MESKLTFRLRPIDSPQSKSKPRQVQRPVQCDILSHTPESERVKNTSAAGKAVQDNVSTDRETDPGRPPPPTVFTPTFSTDLSHLHTQSSAAGRISTFTLSLAFSSERRAHRGSVEYVGLFSQNYNTAGAIYLLKSLLICSGGNGVFICMLNKEQPETPPLPQHLLHCSPWLMRQEAGNYRVHREPLA